MPEYEQKPSPFTAWWQKYIWGLVTKPAEWVNAVWVKVQRDDPTNVYYHRRYRRVPGIETCEVGDAVCYYEANQQFKRDKIVESRIVEIMRRKKRDCHFYYGHHDGQERCKEIDAEADETETNWFIKYGDLGKLGTVRDAYMKQKHRMIWERRHGPVGTGMKSEEPNIRVELSGAIKTVNDPTVGEDAIYSIDNPHSIKIKDGSTHRSSSK